MMSPVKLSGTTTCSATTGSSSATPAVSTASFSAREPAIWNAMSDESTVWNFPSTSVTWTSTIGFPLMTPSAIVLTMPFSTDGMNCPGIAPPTIFDSKTNPSPCGVGEISMSQIAYWP